MDAYNLIEQVVKDINDKYSNGFPSRLSVVGVDIGIHQGVIDELRDGHPSCWIDREVRGGVGVVLGELIRKHDSNYFL